MDKLLNYLYQPVSGGALLNMEFILYLLAAIFILLGILSAASAIFVRRSSPKDEHHKAVECATCGWKGTISRFARVCPKCNDSNFVSEN